MIESYQTEHGGRISLTKLRIAKLGVAMILGILSPAQATGLEYQCSTPPLSVTFDVAGGHYDGRVTGGNLFLQSDIPVAPVVKWQKAKPGKLYTLMMLDLDGDANGAWPEPVAPGENSPVRHWIVGNIPGEWLRREGYLGSNTTSALKNLAILEPYRQPHIPVVSDRYGLYLFEQPKHTDVTPLSGPVTNFDYVSFIKEYKLGEPVASNFFVAIYVSDSPFSGKAFHGNDVSQVWHKGYGNGKLAPSH
jgi:hypothetical protein